MSVSRDCSRHRGKKSEVAKIYSEVLKNSSCQVRSLIALECQYIHDCRSCKEIRE